MSEIHTKSFFELRGFMAKEGPPVPDDLVGAIEVIELTSGIADYSRWESIPQSWFFDSRFLTDFPVLFAKKRPWHRFVFDVKAAVRECSQGKDNPVIRHSRPEIIEYETLSGCFSGTLAAQSFRAPDWKTFLVRLKHPGV